MIDTYVPIADAAEYKIYFPVAGSLYNSNVHTERLAELLINAELQKRTVLIQDPILTQVAQQRAQYMADHNFFMTQHVDLNGIGPNTYVRIAGFKLPNWYSDHPDDPQKADKRANNIESLAAGQSTADGAFHALLGSLGHRKHVLGEDDFYVRQTKYGIGFVAKPGTDYGYYWVVLIAEEDL